MVEHRLSSRCWCVAHDSELCVCGPVQTWIRQLLAAREQPLLQHGRPHNCHQMSSPALQLLQQHIVEEIIDVPVPEVMVKTVEAATHIPQKRVQSYTVEQIIGAPVSQIRKETVEVMQLIPQERTSDHVVEQTVDIPSPQIQEQTVDVVKAHFKGVGAVLHRGANCGRASFTDSLTDSSRDVQVPIPAFQVVQKTIRDPQVHFNNTVDHSSRAAEEHIRAVHEHGCRRACCGTTPGAHDSGSQDPGVQRRMCKDNGQHSSE